MSAATVNPWDDDDARVPTAVDLGADVAGFVLADDVPAPVKDGTMLYADMVNRLLEAAVSASRMTPSLIVTVQFNAGTPSVESFIAPRDAIDTNAIGLIDNGTGDTTIRLLAAHLPPKRVRPVATPNEGTKPTCSADWYESGGYRGARVKTWDNGSAADLKFTVTIF